MSLRILVGVKRVVDYAVKVRVNQAKTGIDLKGVKMSMNPFCEIATEEAVRIKEANPNAEIIAVSIGPKESAQTLQTAMAMGADKSILVETDLAHDTQLQPLIVSRVLSKVVERVKPDIVILGKQSIDDDSNQTGQLLAGMLDWPQATFASKVEINAAERKATVTREIDGGLQTVQVPLPTVVTADLRLNTPRYATLPNIMKAKKKPMETLKLDELLSESERKPRLQVVQVSEPAQRKAGIKIDSVDALLDKLRSEAKVI